MILIEEVITQFAIRELGLTTSTKNFERGNIMNGLNAEERKQLKELQAKAKAAKEASKEASDSLFTKVFNAVKPEEILNLINMTGSARVSKTVKRDDGSKLTCTFINVTPDDEDV